MLYQEHNRDRVMVSVDMDRVRGPRSARDGCTVSVYIDRVRGRGLLKIGTWLRGGCAQGCGYGRHVGAQSEWGFWC